MNLRKLGRMSGMVAAVAMLAMVLQGCGGDDNGSNISQDMYNTLQAEANAAKAALAEAEAEATTAKAAQATAEAAAKEAMAAEMEAKAAQATAEASATAAVAAQAVAESETKAAMAAEMEAKAARATAEAEAKTAAATAAAAATAQAVAESEAKAAEAAQATAEMEAKEAMAAAETAKQEAADAKTAAAAAQSEATEAKAAQATAEAAATAAMAAAETANQEAAAAKEEAEEAEAAQRMAEADRDRYKEMYEDATDVDTVGTTKGAAARAQAARIANSVTPAVTATVGANGVMAKRAMNATVKRGSTSIKKLMHDDDGVSFNLMEGAVTRMTSADTADADATALAGWQGTALAKTGGGVMQSAVVYTDIDKSTVSFSGKYPYTSSLTILSTGAVTVNTTPPAGTVNTHLLVGAIGTETGQLSTLSASSHPHISIDHGLSSAIPSRTLDDIVGANNTNPTTVRGSYDGIPGVYVCNNVCTIGWELSATDGEVLTLTTAQDSQGSLYFKADSPETLLPDADHLTFGVWMIAQDGPAAAGYIRPIAMGNASKFTAEQLAALQGSATYTGQAAGYYATRAAGSAEATSGTFTATATLSANFDLGGAITANTVANGADTGAGQPMPLDALKNAQTAAAGATTRYYRPAPIAPAAISGKIDKFMAEDGTAMDGWVVNLGTAALAPVADVAATVTDGTVSGDNLETAQNTARTNGLAQTMLEGATSGTGYAMEWTGVWDATLHGAGKATFPTGVAGTFQAAAGMANPAANDDGAIDLFNDPGFAGVVGSFGARK